MANCCNKSIIFMWAMPFFSCISVSQCVTFPLPGPPGIRILNASWNIKNLLEEKCLFIVCNIPKTNITGTFGGSNLTFPAFCIEWLALRAVRTTPERLTPPPFQSVADSSASCAAEFASAKKNTHTKKHKSYLLNKSLHFLGVWQNAFSDKSKSISTLNRKSLHNLC